MAVAFRHRRTALLGRLQQSRVRGITRFMGQMGKGRTIFARMAALVLLLALFVAPILSALTHGPGPLAIAAEHTAWHAEHGEPLQTADHDHHSTADHDHTPSAILPDGGGLERHDLTEIWSAHLSHHSGIIRDGPRRPPRLT